MPTHFPAPSLPEVAFLGRSNVGKSSVINTLVGTKLARTSSTPGRTRSINFFEVRWPGKPRPEVIFADLPGYGYAKLSREISQEWPKFIEPYLNERPTLALCMALVDVNVPPQDSDRQLLDFLNASGRDFLLIATKSDRLSNNQLQNASKRPREAYPTAPVIPFSAKTGAGRDQVWKKIRRVREKFSCSRVPILNLFRLRKNACSLSRHQPIAPRKSSRQKLRRLRQARRNRQNHGPSSHGKRLKGVIDLMHVGRRKRGASYLSALKQSSLTHGARRPQEPSNPDTAPRRAPSRRGEAEKPTIPLPGQRALARNFQRCGNLGHVHRYQPAWLLRGGNLHLPAWSAHSRSPSKSIISGSKPTERCALPIPILAWGSAFTEMSGENRDAIARAAALSLAPFRDCRTGNTRAEREAFCP